MFIKGQNACPPRKTDQKQRFVYNRRITGSRKLNFGVTWIYKHFLRLGRGGPASANNMHPYRTVASIMILQASN